MKSFTILVVEDNPITRKMMRFALESEAYEVIEAVDGRNALALAAERLPHLVLQDYVLPDMDGLRLLEGLRLLPGGAKLPVLMITGMVSQIDELRARAGGPTSILPKPLEPSRLVDIVRTHLAASADPPNPATGKRVLVVDDEVLGRKLAALRLRDAGFEVETAAGGEEALGKAIAWPPDAILSDVLMPGMDGFELCGFVRREPRLASIPVVLLSSAFAEDADRRLAGEVGANALLVRTPDMQDAIRAVGAALRAGAPPVPATHSAEDFAGLHAARVQVQLEKQVARNEALLRQGAIQSAALSVVRGLALALASPRDVPSILADVLVHCLDAAGLSTGLLYLATPDNRLRLQAQAGLPSEARESAARAFGQAELLLEVLEGGEPVAYHLEVEGVDPRFRELGEGLARSSALVVPFLVGEERVGVLVLGADSQDLSEHVWLGFARALAAQFGQTIALGRFLARGVASEARYRSLMEQANDAILLMDGSGIVEANRQAEILLGWPRAALMGRAYEDLVVPEEREDAFAAQEALRGLGTARASARHLVRADGSRVSVDVSGSLVRVGEESLVVLIVRDVSDREEAERRLRESEEQYRLLFETNPHPMSIYDPDSQAFLAVNEAAVRLYGYSRDEFLAMTLQGLRPESVGQPPPSDAFAGGIWRHRRKDGSSVVVEVSSSATLFQGRPARLVLATDISEKRQLEEQLLQSQKMEAVGRLAGGVAHDFNNLLGVITGYSELLRGSLDAEHPGQPRVEQIRKAADRAAALTRQLLTFSRKEVLQPTVLDLNEVVADIEKMLQRLIGEDVQLVMRLGADLGRVRADRGQIDQVILNLVVNARDAMPRGGKVTLETANQILDRAAARLYGDVDPGNYVMLAVSDSGHGMDAETVSHIFEPFFTTKEEGKGTGLGLATVFGIVRQSGGHISVYSEAGVGTSFKVLLPRVAGDPTPGNAIASGVRPTGGAETVLLVEDAEALRVMIREILEAAGYTVLEASGPHEGLLKASAHEGPVHLVLTDVVLPRLSGPDLVERIREGRPEIRVLFMSGYTNEAIGQRGVLQAGVQFLQKPFTSEGLLRAVREALDRGGRGGPQ